MANIENIKKYKHIHMLGIGGVSMSGIAEILVNWGFQVSGSNNGDLKLQVLIVLLLKLLIN